MRRPPLEDITVVEIGQYIAAPYASLVLADLGARVIKVEPPDGDGIRTWGPHPGGESAPFLAYNRNKHSVEADLGAPEGAGLLEGILATADVVIQNNRPGVLGRFGFDADAVRARHPHLVYCSISGYGQHSPYAGRPGFDLVIQGVTGMIDITGHEDASWAKVAVPIVDGTAALHATTAILAAVHQRAATGEGATIDISLQASTMSWMMLLGAGLFASGDHPRRLGSAHPFAAPYQAFQAADGPMTIAAGNERHWRRLCAVLDIEHLREDSRFATNAERARHQVELAALVEEQLLERPRAEWIERLSHAGVPCGPVNSLPAALEDPAIVERGLIQEYEHPLAGTVRTIGNPIGLEGYEAPLRRAPVKGEHTDLVKESLLELATPADEEER
jgi:crotonobetainyl-CoA:carnitine CoA-transferase CaiB-like acyl-CoA transferase